jgi:hypothetical protein
MGGFWLVAWKVLQKSGEGLCNDRLGQTSDFTRAQLATLSGVPNTWVVDEQLQKRALESFCQGQREQLTYKSLETQRKGTIHIVSFDTIFRMVVMHPFGDKVDILTGYLCNVVKGWANAGSFTFETA